MAQGVAVIPSGGDRMRRSRGAVPQQSPKASGMEADVTKNQGDDARKLESIAPEVRERKQEC